MANQNFTFEHLVYVFPSLFFHPVGPFFPSLNCVVNGLFLVNRANSLLHKNDFDLYCMHICTIYETIQPIYTRCALTFTNYNQLFLVPPTLRAVPQNGQVAARKGSTVTLECKASGNPVSILLTTPPTHPSTAPTHKLNAF